MIIDQWLGCGRKPALGERTSNLIFRCFEIGRRGIMEEDKKREGDEQAGKKEKQSLPFCTGAPSAEHSRGGLDDEPCDDSREGP